MTKIVLTNKTQWDISFLKQYVKKLESFLDIVEKSKYPFKVTVIEKKDFYDRSFFDLESNSLTLKINLNKQTKEEIAWVFVHEFAHFLCNNNEELKKTALGPEFLASERILQHVFKINNDKTNEIFHDFLPPEVAANFFATLIVGKFYKRHPFSNVKSFLKKDRNGNAKVKRK